METIMSRIDMIKLIFVVFFLLSSLVHAKQSRTALVIGNASYDSAPLANPENDAQDIAATLEKLGFNVILKVNATLREMDEAVRLFGKTLEKDKGVGLFFYAGHGVQSNGRNYLIPIKSGLRREADLKYNALDAGKVLDEMGYANNGLNIAILDACRDNPLSRSFRSGRKGLARPNDVPSGILIAYSTAPGKQASDGTGRNSPYTKALINSMQDLGVPLEIVFKNVIKSVKNETGGKQVPWVSSSVDGDFYFSAAQKKAKHLTPAIDSGSVLLANSDQKFEILYWESILKNPTLNNYKAYLDKYPKGHFIVIAESEVMRFSRISKDNNDHKKPPKSARQISINIDKCAPFIKDWHLTSGPKGNAFDCYSAVLKNKPDNKKALAGIITIEQKYVALADRYIKEKLPKKVLRNIYKLKKVNSKNSDLPRLTAAHKKLIFGSNKKPETSSAPALTISDQSIPAKPAQSATYIQQQRYEEYVQTIEELLLEKNYSKAERYVVKLADINPAGREVVIFRNRIRQAQGKPLDNTMPSVRLNIEQQQIFDEYKGIIEDILESDKLSDKQAYKVNKYIIELKRINPSSPYIKKFTAIYNSKLTY